MPLKKLENKGDTFEISFIRKGEMQMPIDFSVLGLMIPFITITFQILGL